MAQKKKPTLTGILAFVTTIVAGFILITDVLTTDLINNENVLIITGHFKTIYKLRPPRGSLNYELYIQENQNVYKIGADDADCFDYDSFIRETSSNQLIKISIRRKNSFLRNSDLLAVVAVESKGIRYLYPDCINENLENNKIKLPILAIGLMIIGFLFYKYKR